ncbi:L,D-transpeptidase [Chelativorans sp. J32]|uniref:L,D-transpeptidase n=1 Tax=Chelativorans sp. J32 TaxID=935840 RepID=UPI000481F70B|nr:L,D-transpeptidase [Chelativorans sp. J32]
MPVLSRRVFLLSAASALAGCASTAQRPQPAPKPAIPPHYYTMYAPIHDEQFPIAAADLTKIDPKYLRQEVDYDTAEMPGTIVIDTQERFLYLVRENGRALRYGIGVGKEGLAFEGRAVIGYKRKWPRWTPTRSMIEREPERYGPLAAGMEPGIHNPLGPRALYLFKNGADTLYRIHGTTEDWSIGRAVSSGCIRLLNHDIIDLYDRVPTGSRVVVLQQGSSPSV